MDVIIAQNQANIAANQAQQPNQPNAQPVTQQAKQAVKQPTVKAASTDPADEIRKFKKLADDGIITKEEFEAKKKQLLGL